MGDSETASYARANKNRFWWLLMRRFVCHGHQYSFLVGKKEDLANLKEESKKERRKCDFFVSVRLIESIPSIDWLSDQ